MRARAAHKLIRRQVSIGFSYLVRGDGRRKMHPTFFWHASKPPVWILICNRCTPLPPSASAMSSAIRGWPRNLACLGAPLRLPQPQRDAFGERSYPAEQVQKLRMVKRLLDLGFRPGKIMQHSTLQLQQLASAGSAAPSTRHPSLNTTWPCAVATRWRNWATPCARRWPCWD